MPHVKRTSSVKACVTMPDGSTKIITRVTSEVDTNPKLAKNHGRGYRTLGLALAPHKMAGVGNLCPHASPDCIKLCLNVSGRTVADTMATHIIMNARIARTLLYYQDRDTFLAMLRAEIARERTRAIKDGEQLAVRLNVISDIDWAHKHREIIEAFPDVIFYGYTKDWMAFDRYTRGAYPANYELTFSRAETNEAIALSFLGRGHNVSVVFAVAYNPTSRKPLPASWRGFAVIDGDETDLRFLDPRGVVVGLRAKGLARRKEHQMSGFVVHPDAEKNSAGIDNPNTTA